ncbi:hypothetical protein ACQWFV_26420, partial [Salmonella enterica subsp. enterica serovar Infantis]
DKPPAPNHPWRTYYEDPHPDARDDDDYVDEQDDGVRH